MSQSWHGKLEVQGSGYAWFVYVWRNGDLRSINGPYRTKAKATDAALYMISQSDGGYKLKGTVG